MLDNSFYFLREYMCTFKDGETCMLKETCTTTLTDFQKSNCNPDDCPFEQIKRMLRMR